MFISSNSTILFSKYGKAGVICEVGYTYVRKWCLLLVLNLNKQTIKENKEIKVKKNIKEILA